jgi:hypothetical protein
VRHERDRVFGTDTAGVSRSSSCGPSGALGISASYVGYVAPFTFRRASRYDTPSWRGRACRRSRCSRTTPRRLICGDRATRQREPRARLSPLRKGRARLGTGSAGHDLAFHNICCGNGGPGSPIGSAAYLSSSLELLATGITLNWARRQDRLGLSDWTRNSQKKEILTL